MTSGDNVITSDRIAEQLEPALRRVHRAVVMRHVRRGIVWSMRTILAIAALFVLVRLGYVVTGERPPMGVATVLVAFAIGLVVPVVIGGAVGLRRRPSLRAVAERLDLGARQSEGENDHNRVAIALALAEQNAEGPFARAAVRQGYDQLLRIARAFPFADLSRPPWRQSARLGAAALLLTVVGLTVGTASGTAAPGPAATMAQGSAMPRPPAREDGGPESETRSSDERDLRDQRGAAQQSTARDEATPSLSQSDRSVAVGQSDAGAVAGSTVSNRPAQAGSQSAMGTGSPSPKSKKASGERKPREPRDRSSNKKPPEKRNGDEGAGIGRGTSGGGSQSPVSHDWTQHAQAMAGQPEEEETEDEEVEDESESNPQRGGIQPSLKDRNESPTRDLGISGEQGPPGTGRGGPTPPKKSRGTAALVLGVPIPDFVRGRLGPGTTKITHERVDPPVAPGAAAQPVEPAEADEPEPPLDRFRTPSEYATLIRDYLITLHTSDQQETDVTTTPEATNANPAEEQRRP